MAGNIQDLLYESFVEASGGDSQSLQAVLNTAELAGSSGAGGQEAAAAPGPSGNALASAAATAAGMYGDSATSAGSDVQGGIPTSNGESAGSTVASIASTILDSGFGMAGLVKGLMGLFGGGGTTQQPLEKYEMPSPIDFSSAITSTGMSAADYDQTGTPREVSPTAGASGGGSSNATAPISVNVQAMDAQSFLDHSDAIAQAVRGAMLNMSSINDVVNEL
jgi:hypothetical protein